MFVAPNGVDPEPFTPRPKDSALAQRLGADGYPVLAFIGSLFNYEGVEDFLDIGPALIQRFPTTRILIVGGGERQAEVQSKISAMGLSQIIYRPQVPHAEVRSYYSVADCMVYPRRRNRLTDTVTPLKPLEAMAMKKAVVASNVGGHQELIRHDVTGLLYQAGDSEALLDALMRIASDTTLPMRLSDAGRRYVLSERTWSLTATAEIEAYEHALRRRS
jgi:glycosyltransferase involved in cell wall biosynthesis